MDYAKMFEEKAEKLPNRRLYDEIYNNLTSRQQKTLMNISSSKWYKNNTNKTKIELLAEDKHIKLLKEPIYKDTDDLFDNEIIGYKEDTLFDGDTGTKLKINKSEVVYFKEIRKQIKELKTWKENY